MIQYAWTLETLCLVKEAWHKRQRIGPFDLYEMSRIGKDPETESSLELVRDWREEEQEVTTNGYKVSLWGDEDVLELDSSDGHKLCEYIKKSLNATL